MAGSGGRRMPIVRSVERAARVMQALIRSREGRRVGELSRELDLHKTTVVRLLHTLVTIGVARKDESSQRYTWDPSAWLGLSCVLHEFTSGAEAAHGVLGALAEHSRETAALMLPDVYGRNMVVIASALSAQPVRVDPNTMPVVPMHALAAGKAYLADLSQEAAGQYVQGGLARVTERTITSSRRLGQELAEARRLGYAVSREEALRGGAGVAVAVRDEDGKLKGAVTLAVPVERMREANVRRWVPLLRRASLRLSQLLSTLPRPPQSAGRGDERGRRGGVEGEDRGPHSETALREKYRVV